MNADFMELLVCPADEAHKLSLTAGKQDAEVREGSIACQTCGSLYRIQHGILQSASVGEEALSEIKIQEIKRRDMGYEKVKNYQLDPDRLAEYDAIKTAVGDCAGQWVMDAGCGVGQTTKVFQGAARGVGIDFSLTGLLNFNREPVAKMDLIQGDVCVPYCRAGAFDTVISSQVLEHIPTPEERLAFLSQLSRALKPSGLCVLTVYNYDRTRVATGIPKEGRHANGIFYHCYSEDELRGEMSRYFEVEEIWGVNILLPMTFRLVNALGSKVVLWERIWRRRPVARQYGKLLLAVCRKRPART